MAQMQKQMEAQMQSMMSGMGSMQGSMQVSMPMTMQSSSSTTSQGLEQQMQHQQAPKPQQAPQQQQEMIHQEFFVPLRQINQVQKNALAEATAMAKMKDGFFEVVVNIQRFEPEEIKVYLEGQAVMVTT